MYNDDSIRYTKKAGLRAAVPLYEALVLPFIPNKQHRSPRRICMHTRVPKLIHTAQDIHILRTSIAAMSWNKNRIYQIP